MASQELPVFLFLYIWEATDSNNTLGSIQSLFINHSMKYGGRSQDSFLSDSNELVCRCRPFGTVVIVQKMLHKITQEEYTIHC